MDDPEDNLTRNFQKEKTEVLMLIAVLTVIATFFLLLFWKSNLEQSIQLAGGLGYGFFILWWCRIDAAQKDYQLSTALSLSLILFEPIALPYYFFASRGFKEGLIATGRALLFFFATILIQILVFAIYSMFAVIDIPPAATN